MGQYRVKIQIQFKAFPPKTPFIKLYYSMLNFPPRQQQQQQAQSHVIATPKFSEIPWPSASPPQTVRRRVSQLSAVNGCVSPENLWNSKVVCRRRSFFPQRRLNFPPSLSLSLPPKLHHQNALFQQVFFSHFSSFFCVWRFWPCHIVANQECPTGPSAANFTRECVCVCEFVFVPWLWTAESLASLRSGEMRRKRTVLP